MKSLLNPVRSGLMALGLAMGVAAPAVAAPGFVDAPAVPQPSAAVTKIGWDCSVSPCRDTATGALRDRGDIKGRELLRENGTIVERGRAPSWAPPPASSRRVWNDNWDRPRYRDRDNRWYRDDGGVYRRGDYRRDYYRRGGADVIIELGTPRYRYEEPRYAPRGIRASDAHVQWCYNRWRSYHAYSNTYQPSKGPRRACISPYS